MADKETLEERAERIYNEGKRDGNAGDYDPPHGGLWNTTVGSDQDITDSRNYDKGYTAGRK